MWKLKLRSNPVQWRFLRILPPISTGNILSPKFYWKGDFILSQRLPWRYISFLYSHWHLVPVNHIFKTHTFSSNCMGDHARHKVRNECLVLNMKSLTSARDTNHLWGKKKCQQDFLLEFSDNLYWIVPKFIIYTIYLKKSIMQVGY